MQNGELLVTLSGVPVMLVSSAHSYNMLQEVVNLFKKKSQCLWPEA